ncbi:hypothetical protein [Thioclava atlantica]|uniref:hypothetical protein n=1 Tax=Thioclava atlantica TaxID=1317124 RepID=UPI000B1C05A7|nr:hypothetical protein [Thioclava atlantica]
MVEMFKIPEGVQPVQVAEEHLAYYTPEKPSPVLVSAEPAPQVTGLEALELMYEYYGAA